MFLPLCDGQASKKLAKNGRISTASFRKQKLKINLHIQLQFSGSLKQNQFIGIQITLYIYTNIYPTLTKLLACEQLSLNLHTKSRHLLPFLQADHLNAIQIG